jgi:O-antigen ligase
MLWEHWLTGVGLGSYALLSSVYLKGFPPNILFDRVHNEYLEIFIEFGIPMATFFFLWLFWGVLKLLMALLRKLEEKRQRRDYLIIGIASFSGFLGFLVHGLADFGWRLPVNLVYAVTLLAITVSCLSSDNGSTCANSSTANAMQTNEVKTK